MILFYALGGGFGHITRAVAIIRTLGLSEPVTLLVSPARMGQLPQLPRQFHYVLAPAADCTPAQLQHWVLDQLQTLKPSLLIVDAFPGGLLGELCDVRWPAGLTVYHSARLLRWTTYQAILGGALPDYDRILLMESIHEDHLAELSKHSNQIDDVELIDEAVPARNQVDQNSPIPLWLVVHSGPESEIHQLLSMAEDIADIESISPRMMLIAPCRPAGLPEQIIYCADYPADPWFDVATRIFTACGFNLMRQLKRYRYKHVFMPMHRRFDDQFERASQAHQAGSIKAE